MGEASELPKNEPGKLPESESPIITNEKKGKFSHAFRAAIGKARSTLGLKPANPEKPSGDEQASFIPFPAESRLVSLNRIGTLPAEGQKLMLEMLAYSRDFLRNFESADTTPERKLELRGMLADLVAQTIDSDYTAQTDPENKAAIYRKKFYEMIEPLSASQIALAIRTIKPNQDFSPPQLKGLPGFAGPEPYRPKVQNLDMTKL